MRNIRLRAAVDNVTDHRICFSGIAINKRRSLIALLNQKCCASDLLEKSICITCNEAINLRTYYSHELNYNNNKKTSPRYKYFF